MEVNRRKNYVDSTGKLGIDKIPGGAQLTMDCPVTTNTYQDNILFAIFPPGRNGDNMM